MTKDLLTTPFDTTVRLTPQDWGVIIAALETPNPFIGARNILDCERLAWKLRAQLNIAD